jgi:Fe2+ transport system protein FeoA
MRKMEIMFETVKRPDLARYPAGTGVQTPKDEIPLSTLREGDYGTVSRMDGDEVFRSKMLALGIIPGKDVIVARGDKHQPFLLRVDESRVMVDWNTSGRIYVRPGVIHRKGGI